MGLETKSRQELIDIIDKRNSTIEDLKNKYEELNAKIENLDLNKLQKSFQELEEKKANMDTLISQLKIMRAEMVRSMIDITDNVSKLKEKLQ